MYAAIHGTQMSFFQHLVSFVKCKKSKRYRTHAVLAPWRSWLAQLTHNQKVVGSSPTGATCGNATETVKPTSFPTTQSAVFMI